MRACFGECEQTPHSNHVDADGKVRLRFVGHLKIDHILNKAPRRVHNINPVRLPILSNSKPMIRTVEHPLDPTSRR